MEFVCWIMKNSFEQYLALRDEIDQLSDNLHRKHTKHMKCKVGCDMCCMDYRIFPLEFHFILEELRTQKEKPILNKKASDETCIFLRNHQCSIYHLRPVICRTHGLPLIFMNDSGDWELSACELNFRKFDMDDFNEMNTFPQDTYNSKLFLLNKVFIQAFEEKKYSEFDLVPIKKLNEYI